MKGTERSIDAVFEEMEEALERLSEWSKAYPIENFPEPDFVKAHEVLKANGMSIDAISASCMRHVITQVTKMVEPVLAKVRCER